MVKLPSCPGLLKGTDRKVSTNPLTSALNTVGLAIIREALKRSFLSTDPVPRGGPSLV